MHRTAMTTTAILALLAASWATRDGRAAPPPRNVTKVWIAPIGAPLPEEYDDVPRQMDAALKAAIEHGQKYVIVKPPTTQPTSMAATEPATQPQPITFDTPADEVRKRAAVTSTALVRCFWWLLLAKEPSSDGFVGRQIWPTRKVVRRASRILRDQRERSGATCCCRCR